MSDEVTRQAAESLAERNVSREHYDWMVQNRNEWQQQAEALGGAAQRMTLDNCRLVAERDAATVDLKQAEENNHGLIIEVQNMRAEVAGLTEDRDTWQQRAKALADALETAAQRMTVDRRGLIEDRDAAEEKCRKLHAENEGLRADLLAHPLSYSQELAIERKRHLELLDDHNLQATMIETLQEALKRTETLLAKAQAQHIDPRLKGFLATISQLADQSQDMIP